MYWKMDLLGDRYFGYNAVNSECQQKPEESAGLSGTRVTEFMSWCVNNDPQCSVRARAFNC